MSASRPSRASPSTDRRASITRAKAFPSHITTCSCLRMKSSLRRMSLLGRFSSVIATGRSRNRASRKYSQSSGQSTVFSRSVPQQAGQISPCTPGQCRFARLFSHNLQGVFTLGCRMGHLHRIIAALRIRSSYHQNVPRTDLYLKVELDLDPKESPERVAAEICRTIRRVYGVRKSGSIQHGGSRRVVKDMR